ncbi:MAG: hypothetical protein MUE44_34180 [Oscillatoriaceae cyanobacterium Prado104]|nr:hypothetical protein [Oscillatoriaceae cyanobacterium Prado104]
MSVGEGRIDLAESARAPGPPINFIVFAIARAPIIYLILALSGGTDEGFSQIFVGARAAASVELQKRGRSRCAVANSGRTRSPPITYNPTIPPVNLRSSVA